LEEIRLINIQKDEDLAAAEELLSQTDSISLRIESALVDIQNFENELKDVSTSIAEEQSEIQRLREEKEHLTKEIERAKENYSERQEATVSPSSTEASGQNDFRHLLKKRNNAAAAPAPTEKQAPEIDQKDFRNLLKKRPGPN